MPEPLWPTRRPDGTVSVAARYRVESTEAFRELEVRVEARIGAFADSNGWKLLPELLRNPYLVRRQDDLVDVVFDGTSHSRKWRDWLVFLVGDLRDRPIPEVSLVGLWDLVSGLSREFRPDGSTIFGGD